MIFKEFKKCEVDGCTKMYKDGLWMCASREVCGNKIFSARFATEYPLPFCKIPLVEKLNKTR